MSRLPALEASLLAFVMLYLLFIGLHKVKFARHLLILYPVLTLIAGAILAQLLNNKWVGVTVGSVVVVWTSIYTAAFAFVLTAQPTRIAASEWIAAHVPPEEVISGAPEVLFDWLLPEIDIETGDEDAEWVLILVPDLEVFQKYQNHPENYQKQDWYPLNEIAVAETLAFYTRVLGEDSPYELSKTFKSTPQFLGVQISDSGSPFPMRALAHPELRVYRHRD